MAVSAQFLRCRRIRQCHFLNIHGFYRTGGIEFGNPVQMAWIPCHVRALYGDIIGWDETSRRRRDISKATTGFQNREALFMYFSTHGVEDHIAGWNGLREILACVIDDFIGAETTDIVVVAGAGGGIDRRAKMFCVLHRKAANTPGAGMNKDCFTRGKRNRIQRNNRRRPDKRQSGGVDMGQACGLARDKRRIYGDRFGIRPLLGLGRYAIDLITGAERRDTGTDRPHHARKIDARRIRKIQDQIALARAVADFPIHRIDARGVNIDHEFTRASNRIDDIAQLEHIRTAIGI